MALDLGKQIGPLPLGAWIAVGGTGIGVALWARGGGSGTVSDESALDEWSSVGTGVNGGWIDMNPPDSPPPSGDDDQPVTDNDEYGRRAIQWLIAEGYDPALSQSAITLALQERRLSVREYALWWLVLREFGPPPYPVVVPPPGGGEPPTPDPPPNPPNQPPPRNGGKWHLITPVDTLARLARRYYRDTSRESVQRIYQANRKGVLRPNGSRGWLESPNSVLRVGWRLFIPGPLAPDANVPEPPLPPGQPPGPGNPPPGPGNPNPPPPNDPTARTRWHRVKPGDTLRNVAKRWYGDNSREMQRRIFEANRKGKKRPDGSKGWMRDMQHPLFPTRRLFIPRDR